MSDATGKALEEAIAAHFADERDGAVMTGYFLVAKGKTFDDLAAGRTKYITTCPDEMEYDQVLGLARFGLLDVENGFNEDEEG